MLPVILASRSPRRKALLEDLGVDFAVHASHAPERDDGDTPSGIVEANAREKCRAVAGRCAEAAWVIAADTLVFLEERVLSKPADLEDARRMLRALSGNTHQVVTGIAVQEAPSGRMALGSETTDVTFRLLSDAEIDRFIAIVRPMDRAGAYTVDGPGSLLVSRYDGCYQNVLGLPIVRLDKLLRTLGISLFDLIRPDKARFL